MLSCICTLISLLRAHGTRKWNPIAAQQFHLNIVVVYKYKLKVQSHIYRKNFLRTWTSYIIRVLCLQVEYKKCISNINKDCSLFAVY